MISLVIFVTFQPFWLKYSVHHATFHEASSLLVFSTVQIDTMAIKLWTKKINDYLLRLTDGSSMGLVLVPVLSINVRDSGNMAIFGHEAEI